jgi:hypothetical protein
MVFAAAGAAGMFGIDSELCPTKPPATLKPLVFTRVVCVPWLTGVLRPPATLCPGVLGPREGPEPAVLEAVVLEEEEELLALPLVLLSAPELLDPVELLVLPALLVLLNPLVVV